MYKSALKAECMLWIGFLSILSSFSFMNSPQFSIIFSVAIVSLLYRLYRRWSRVSISHIRGPEPQSWLLGNMAEFYQSQAGSIDSKWQEEFGNVLRFRGYFGKEQLFTTDPKAIQYIHNNSYKFVKAPIVRREFVRRLTGKGLTYAEGDVHRRQRRVNTPAFGFSEIKTHAPLFADYAKKLVKKWQDIIGQDGSAKIDISKSISRATMDVIGEAAFDYKFGSLDNTDNALKKAFEGVALKTFGVRSERSLLIQGILEYFPRSLKALYVDWAPSLAFARNVDKLGHQVARELVEEKGQALLQGKGKRDIMSLLVKANSSENKKTGLTDSEIYSQMQTIMIAGHETTSNTLTWTFFELSRRPDIQNRLRQEVQFAFKGLHDRGETALTLSDFESMEYFTAFVKEIFRYYPVALGNFRQATQDIVLPFSKPIITSNGEEIMALPIPKGTNIFGSISGFNRNKDVFGRDAEDFNPERWLNGTVDNGGVSLGAYSNLATFGGGLRACLGWRFALLEYQTFLAEIVDKLEFTFADGIKAKDVRREACALMTPTLEGRVHEGPQMPLKVSHASSNE